MRTRSNRRERRCAPRSGRAARAVQQLALHVQRWAHDRVGNTVAEEQSVCEQEPDRDAGADVPEPFTGAGVVQQGDCAPVRLAIAFVLRRRMVGGDPTAGRSAARPSSHQPRAAHMRADDSGSARATGGNHRSVPRSAFSALLREPWAELASQKRKARKATPRIPRRSRGSSGRLSMPRGGPSSIWPRSEVHLDLDHTRCRWGPFCLLFG